MTARTGTIFWRGYRLSPAGLLVVAVRVLWQWSERARQRRDLETLDDRMLEDIGLHRADVARECAKPFWRP